MALDQVVDGNVINTLNALIIPLIFYILRRIDKIDRNIDAIDERIRKLELIIVSEINDAKYAILNNKANKRQEDNNNEVGGVFYDR